MTRTHLCLGRHGDILSLLPLLHHEWRNGDKPRLMVAKEFAGLLDGVSYVDPLIYGGPHYEIEQAAAQAGEVVCSQVNGPMEMVRAHTYRPQGFEHAQKTSWQKDQWLAAGGLKLWDDNLPLVFDRRDKARESALVEAALPKRPGRKSPEEKLILVALGSTSSPFPYSALLLELLRLKFTRGYRILDLSTVKAERLYDLLALYERAHCLVAADSAPLHLARAVPTLPVMALANDQPILWHGSVWQPQHRFYCRYHDFPARALELLEQVDGSPVVTGNTHVWNACESPQRIADSIIACPIQPGQCGRDSRIMLKDDKPVPYLRDCLRMGLQRTATGAYLMLTRPDTRQDDNARMPDTEAMFAYRLTRTGGGDTFSPVADMFCARKEWWQSRLAEIPDLLLGGDYFWSNCLWALFRKHGAADVTGAVYRQEAKA